MINYYYLSQSIEYYNLLGFKRIESPWTVTKAISDITKPEEVSDFQLVHEDGKVLVASAEQSFLYLFNKGFLPAGKYQSTTPCFRKNSFDELHTKYFIKNELIVTDEVSQSKLNFLIDAAQIFFYNLLKLSQIYEKLHVIENNGVHDIMLDGVELGSYGIRRCKTMDWIFGTGIAEPRCSKMISYLRRMKNGISP